MVTRGTEYNGTAKVLVSWTCDPESDECEHSWHRDNTNRSEYYAGVYGLTVETVQEETDIHPEWVVQGRYGYFYVDETRPGDGCNAVYDTVDRYKSRKAANRVAKALNRAYRRGTGEK